MGLTTSGGKGVTVVVVVVLSIGLSGDEGGEFRVKKGGIEDGRGDKTGEDYNVCYR